MQCPECKEQISLFLDKRLTAAEAAEFDRHIASCGECRKLLEETRAAAAFVKQDPQRPLPAGFMGRLNDRLDRETEKKSAFTFGFTFRAAAGALTLVLCLVIVRNTWQGPSRMKTVVPEPPRLERQTLPAADAVSGGINKKAAPVTRGQQESPRPAVVFKEQYRVDYLAGDREKSDKSLNLKVMPAPHDQRAASRLSALSKEKSRMDCLDSGQGKNDKSLNVKTMPAPALEQQVRTGTAGHALTYGMSEERIAVQSLEAEAGRANYVQFDREKKTAYAALRRMNTAAPDASTVVSRWTGSYSDIGERLQAVIKDQRAWEALWGRHSRSGEVAPYVDFNRSMVVAVFMGEKRTGGYGTAIDRVVRGADAVTVYYSETSPAPGAAAVQSLTRPFSIAVVERTDKPVVFVPVPAQ